MKSTDLPEKRDVLWVLVDESLGSEGARSMFPSPEGVARAAMRMGQDVLAENLSGFIKVFGEVLDTLPSSCGKLWEVDELTCSLSVNGSGKVSLIGEVGAAIQSSMTITFKRNRLQSGS